MATAQMDTVIRHLRRAVLRQDGAGRTDGQLLGSFIDQKDEAAFEALVRRHAPMVFGVCRRVVGNHHDAEDAFQATFLVLARKASSVRPRERVANWLHGVALRTATKARATITKRWHREKQVTEMPEPEAAQKDQWRDLQPLLDQELNGLPENYRLPILLCDLEGKTIKDAAQQLGWPQGSLAGRLARGRKRLAKRLASRGVVLSAGSLAAVVSQNVASAGVPTSLLSSTVKAAAMIAAGQATVAGVVPAKVAVLTEGVLKTMLLTKLKIVAVLLVVAALGGTAGVICRTQAEEPLDTQQAQEKPTPKAENGKPKDQKGPAAEVELRKAEADLEQAKAEREMANINLQQAEKDQKRADFLYTVAKKRFDDLTLQAPLNLDFGTVTDAGRKKDAPKTDLDRLQGIWSVVSIEEGGKPAKLEKAVFMVDGKRACWQTSESEMLGGLYLDPASKPKTYDFVMSERTMEGIYSLDGDTLRLCHDVPEAKRPVGFTTAKGSHQVLLVLKRIYGPEVFPYRLADGTKAFPPVIERAKKAAPPPQVAPTPKDTNKYDLGPTVPKKKEPTATKSRQKDFPVKATEGKRFVVPMALDFGCPVRAMEGKRFMVPLSESHEEYRVPVNQSHKEYRVPVMADEGKYFVVPVTGG